MPFSDRLLASDVLPGGSLARLLLLHGAGLATNRCAFQQLRYKLESAGISSCAFDFIGHGETGGTLLGSNLDERTRQVLAVINAGKLTKQYAVLAASMSGYTAVKLLMHQDIRRLILIVPAAYAREAYAVPFGNQFSEIIRQPRSWEYSDAWEILNAFTGRLLLIAAERDEVVPLEVIERFFTSASRAAERKLYVIPRSSHKILHFLAMNPKEYEDVVETIRIFLDTEGE